MECQLRRPPQSVRTCKIPDYGSLDYEPAEAVADKNDASILLFLGLAEPLDVK